MDYINLFTIIIIGSCGATVLMYLTCWIYTIYTYVDNVLSCKDELEKIRNIRCVQFENKQQHHHLTSSGVKANNSVKDVNSVKYNSLVKAKATATATAKDTSKPKKSKYDKDDTRFDYDNLRKLLN